MAHRPFDYLLPVAGLTITGTWQLGAVTLMDPDAARRLISDHPSRLSPHPLSRIGVDDFAEGLEWASAHVSATSTAEAIDLIRSAVELLRVFQQSQSRWETTHFGLPGELQDAGLDYLVLGETSGVGWTFEGHHQGWTFTPDQVELFPTLPGFVFAAAAIGSDRPSEGQRRALLASRLASQAILEPRSSLKIVYSVVAAEAMLLERANSGQSLLLARRCVFFLCGDHEGALCGRDRPTCPALAHDPTTSAGRRRLKAFQERGLRDVRWKCSEWHHVLDWYSARSDVLHGGTWETEKADADKALFWLVTRLVPAALAWFAEHPLEPIAELDAAIKALPAPPDWERIIGGDPTGSGPPPSRS